MLKLVVAAILAIVAGPALAQDTVLYSGANGPPEGWADGYKYSLATATECKRLMSRVPLNAPSRPLTTCITRDKRPRPPTS
jgi:hypothetical protein